MSVRAVIFDLDETLIDARAAWRYTLEEAIASVCGRRVDASVLVEEYRRRPWLHALGVVVAGESERERCAALCDEMFSRSALKRLLVHEGIGMGLDRVRGARIEVGAISRQAHATALKQVQSTGLDRFLSVLSATPAGEGWDAAARFDQCLAFLEYDPAACVFVSGEAADRVAVAARGAACFHAGWLGEAEDPVMATPWDILPAISLRT